MDEILRLENITKIYPNGVTANKDANLSVRKGEIHALVGENGAGKSTLMKIIFGMEQPTEGNIIYNGKQTQIKSPLDAIACGIGMVHQHFMLVESMTVAENIVLGAEPGKGPIPNNRAMIEQTKEIIEKYNFVINPKEKISDLPIGTRQKVEILKALYKGAQVLILDEPTAVLTPQETTELFRELRGLRDMGHTIIFISHKLNEIKEICDRITIMRNGTTVGVHDVGSVSQQEISNLMVGKDIDWNIEKNPPKRGEVILDVKNVSVLDEAQRSILKEVSFSLHAGTILGIVGVEGNGQSELVEAITGLHKADAGSIKFHGNDIADSSIKQIREMGLAHIPQDRMLRGAVVNGSIEDNMIATFIDKEEFSSGPVLKTKKIRSWSEKLIKDFMVKTDGPEVPVKMLSGGNIQKVIVAREFSSNADCIIADQPTRGIDVGAAKFIHRKLIEMRDNGVAIMLISADLSEIMDVSDSLLVMYGGRFVAYFPDASKVSEEELGQYMLGVKQQTSEEVKGCIA